MKKIYRKDNVYRMFYIVDKLARFNFTIYGMLFCGNSIQQLLVIIILLDSER